MELKTKILVKHVLSDRTRCRWGAGDQAWLMTRTGTRTRTRTRTRIRTRTSTWYRWVEQELC